MRISADCALASSVERIGHLMMWWPPYRRRVEAEADKLMEYYGDQVQRAATKLSTTARRNLNFRKARFYRYVARYLEIFIDIPQAPYGAEKEILLQKLLDRTITSKTRH
jgi:hypothetical protein